MDALSGYRKLPIANRDLPFTKRKRIDNSQPLGNKHEKTGIHYYHGKCRGWIDVLANPSSSCVPKKATPAQYPLHHDRSTTCRHDELHGKQMA